MSDKPTDFRPTPKQRRLLAAMQETAYAGTLRTACEKTGVAQSTVDRWFTRPGFAEWWLAEAQHFFTRELPRVYAVLLDQAFNGGPSGSGTAAKLFLDRFDPGYGPNARQKPEPAERPTSKDLAHMTTSELLELGVRMANGD